LLMWPEHGIVACIVRRSLALVKALRSARLYDLVLAVV
jgi:hypothetical protein